MLLPLCNALALDGGRIVGVDVGRLGTEDRRLGGGCFVETDQGLGFVELGVGGQREAEVVAQLRLGFELVDGHSDGHSDAEDVSGDGFEDAGPHVATGGCCRSKVQSQFPLLGYAREGNIVRIGHVGVALHFLVDTAQIL